MQRGSPQSDEFPGKALQALYLEGAWQDVANLEGLLARMAEDDAAVWEECRLRMREIAHNVKGQGTSFGYPLMTRVGTSLSLLLKCDSSNRAALRKLLAAHVTTLRAVLENEIEGTGGELGETLARRLEDLVARFS